VDRGYKRASRRPRQGLLMGKRRRSGGLTKIKTPEKHRKGKPGNNRGRSERWSERRKRALK